MASQQPYSSSLVIQSSFISEDFLPDGDVSKVIWQQAEWVRFDHDSSARKNHPEAETQVASLWTPTYLYFAFRCKYSTLNLYEGEDPAKEQWGLWDRDVVEVFLNPEPARVNHYYEFEVAPNNLWIDLEIDLDKKPFNNASWNSHFEHATWLDPKNRVWTCEMRIPVRSMGVPVMRPKMEWRVNFYRADGLGDNTQRRLLCWSPVLGEKPNFHVPSRFGIIRFVEQ